MSTRTPFYPPQADSSGYSAPFQPFQPPPRVDLRSADLAARLGVALADDRAGEQARALGLRLRTMVAEYDARTRAADVEPFEPFGPVSDSVREALVWQDLDALRAPEPMPEPYPEETLTPEASTIPYSASVGPSGVTASGPGWKGALALGAGLAAVWVIVREADRALAARY